MSERETRAKIPEGVSRVINTATGEVKLTAEGLRQQNKELTAQNARLREDVLDWFCSRAGDHIENENYQKLLPELKEVLKPCNN